MSNSRVRQNQYNHITNDEIQCKSRKCPTPELDKTNKKRQTSMNIKYRKCLTPELDKTNNNLYKSMTINVNLWNVQLQS